MDADRRSDLFRALFTPRGVALVGVSGDPAKASARPQRYLAKHGYTGAVVLVNPGRSEVLGLPAVASLRDAPCPIDHAFVMVPARAVEGVVRDCAETGVPVVTIFSDGFADMGAEGRARQDAIVEIARRRGIRLIGPNSMGVIDTASGTTLTVNTVMDGLELMHGSVALVSQSGSMIGSLLSRAQARGVGFSRLVSVGNEADLSVGEITDLLVDDPATRVILLFLETLRDSERLAAAARRAFAVGKPVIAYKLGQSDAGRALAQGHTGALAGPRENVTAFFRAHGIAKVECLESLFEAPVLFTSAKPTAGCRVAVVTTTGGAAAMVVDRLGVLGAELMPAPRSLIEKLLAQGLHVHEGAIIDLTAAGTRKETYQVALDELIASPDCDAVVAVVGSSGMSHPEHAVEPIIAAHAQGKPLAVFVAPEAPRTLKLLMAAGVAAFRTPEACADSLGALLNWRAPRDVVPAHAPDAIATAVEGAGQGVIDEASSRHVFDALGITSARSALIRTADEAVDLGFPVVAKVVSPDIPHKTEAGGVRLGLGDGAALRAAASEILSCVKAARPDAAIRGILVQEMHSGLGEVIVGYRRDTEVGPIVVLGVGGTLAEIYRDIALRIAPIRRDEAMEMIEEVRGLAPIRGYRGAVRGDLAALAEAVANLSQLACATTVREAEINPLIVKPEGAGVIAVDGLLVIGDDAQ
jgi:acyl-CoA synthetase (NDP forming)